MFVCLCNAIREAEVRGLANAGSRTADSIYSALGCEPHCATCTDFIQTIIDSETPAAATAG